MVYCQFCLHLQLGVCNNYIQMKVILKSICIFSASQLKSQRFMDELVIVEIIRLILS